MKSKRQEPKLNFSTSEPILPGYIYLLQQAEVKKVFSKGSLERANLSGNWIVLKTFEKTEK
jgi:hypothetical protein